MVLRSVSSWFCSSSHIGPLDELSFQELALNLQLGGALQLELELDDSVSLIPARRDGGPCRCPRFCVYRRGRSIFEEASDSALSQVVPKHSEEHTRGMSGKLVQPVHHRFLLVSKPIFWASFVNQLTQDPHPAGALNRSRMMVGTAPVGSLDHLDRMDRFLRHSTP